MKREHIIQRLRFIEQRDRIDKYEAAALKELLRVYNKARKDTLRQIGIAARRRYHGSTQIRLRLLLKEIDDKIREFTQQLTPAVAKSVAVPGKYSYTDTNKIISWDGAVPEYQYVTMSEAQIAAMVTSETLGGHTLGNWLWRALNADNKALKDDIRAGLVRGVGYNKLMRELGDGYDKLFDAKSAKRNLETVVKSYIQSVNAKAHRDIYAANESIIKGYKWSAIMENGDVSTGRGVCPRCMALDNNEYKQISDGPDCPLHAACRCQWLPLTKTWREMGLDVPEMNTKYRKWYERDLSNRTKLAYGLTDKDFSSFWWGKDKAWQNNAVGPVRARLIRGHVIKFKSIVDKNGDLIPLDQLPITEKQLHNARKRT